MGRLSCDRDLFIWPGLSGKNSGKTPIHQTHQPAFSSFAVDFFAGEWVSLVQE